MSLLIKLSVLVTTMSCLACTSNSTSKDGFALPSLIADIITPDPSAKNSPIEIVKIKESLNADPNYRLTEADIQMLVSEGIVESGSELKAWVE